MRALIIIVVAAILGFFGYQYLVNERTPGEAVGAATEAAEQVGSDAAAQADATVTETVEAATDAAADVAATAEAAAGDAAQAVDDATDAAQDAVDELLDADSNDVAPPVGESDVTVEETVADDSSVVVTGDTTVAPTAEEAAAAAAEIEAAAQAEAEAAAAAAADTAGATTDAADAMSPADLLDPANFDATKVVEMIDGSDLSAVQKTALSAAVNAAKDNPALLEATLTRLREALGL